MREERESSWWREREGGRKERLRDRSCHPCNTTYIAAIIIYIYRYIIYTAHEEICTLYAVAIYTLTGSTSTALSLILV